MGLHSVDPALSAEGVAAGERKLLATKFLKAHHAETPVLSHQTHVDFRVLVHARRRHHTQFDLELVLPLKKVELHLFLVPRKVLRQ